MGSQLPCAWFSLDESDNDLIDFLIGILSAMRTISANIGEGPLALLLSSQAPISCNAIMVALINEITKTILYDFTFVFDDYHMIKTQSIHDTLAYLLDHLPPYMHVIIASRSILSLPLACLRTQGELTDINAIELRFLPEEVETFLNEMMHLGLSTRDVVLITERTEGWIAGLQLAVLSLQKQKDYNTFIKAFTGRHRNVVDYFNEEVYHRQPRDVQTFLLKTSILEWLNSSLCEAIIGQGDEQTMLVNLEKANLFLFPLDEERYWFRYHQLFRGFLYSQLLHSFPGSVDALQHKANRWYEHNQFAAETIKSTITDRAFERVVVLAEQIALPMQAQSQCDALPLVEPLSVRELEVLHSIANGSSSREIARQMIVAESTIKWHIKNIYGKLNVHSRTQMIAIAQKLKL